MAICGHTAAAGLAKVNVAREFTDDQDIKPRDEFGLQTGSANQFFVTNGGTKVGEQAEVFAQAQNGLFWAQGTLEFVVFPIAYGAKQNGI